MYPHHSQPREMTTKSPGNHRPMFEPFHGSVGLEAIPRAAPLATGEHIWFCWGVVAQPSRKPRLSSSPARSCGAFTFLKNDFHLSTNLPSPYKRLCRWLGQSREKMVLGTSFPEFSPVSLLLARFVYLEYDILTSPNVKYQRRVPSPGGLSLDPCFLPLPGRISQKNPQLSPQIF